MTANPCEVVSMLPENAAPVGPTGGRRSPRSCTQLPGEADKCSSRAGHFGVAADRTNEDLGRADLPQDGRLIRAAQSESLKGRQSGFETCSARAATLTSATPRRVAEVAIRHHRQRRSTVQTLLPAS